MRSDDITLLACIVIVGTPVFAVSMRIMLRAAADAVLRVRGAPQPAPALQAPEQVAALQAELEELRAQVARMAATEAFYAQLQAPSSAAAVATTT